MHRHPLQRVWHGDVLDITLQAKAALQSTIKQAKRQHMAVFSA